MNNVMNFLKVSSFSDNEKKLLAIENTSLTTIKSDEKYYDLEMEYFKRMPCCNLTPETANISIDESGSAFIDKLFTKYVTDKTLVVSTRYEHSSVTDQLETVTNKILLTTSDLRENAKNSIDTIIEQAKQVENVFVYIIGTQITTGEITPQDFFIGLKKAFKDNNISNIVVLDDVHGMFIVPRDYSLFDYVLYTAHAIVPAYEMGLLISKDNLFGNKYYYQLSDYLMRLDIVLRNQNILFNFKNTLLQCFNDFLKYPDIRVYTHTVQHIFALELNRLYIPKSAREKLLSYNIVIPMQDMQISNVRIRFQEFVFQDYDKIQEGLLLLRKTLENAIYLKELTE